MNDDRSVHHSSFILLTFRLSLVAIQTVLAVVDVRQHLARHMTGAAVCRFRVGVDFVRRQRWSRQMRLRVLVTGEATDLIEWLVTAQTML